MLPGPAVPGCCLVSLHFLCYILCSRSVLTFSGEVPSTGGSTCRPSRASCRTSASRSPTRNTRTGSAKSPSSSSTPPTYASRSGLPGIQKTLHCWASHHSLGFEDEDLGSSPGWWAATVATYCPSRPGELPKFLSSKPCE